MSASIEQYEGHEVTTAAISCNIGSGLLEAMKIEPHVYRGGELVDVVVRMRIKRVTHEPVTKDDYEGPWKRIHVAIPLAAVPTTNNQVAKLLDHHITQVSKHRELPGQRTIDDEITGEPKKKRTRKAKDDAAPKRRSRRSEPVAEPDAVVAEQW